MAVVVTGCSHSPDRGSAAGGASLRVLTAPPDITVTEAGPSRRDSSLLERLEGEIAGSRGRRVEASSAALLYNTGWGRAFLATPDSRALALGAPPRQCPGLGVVAGGPGTPAAVVAEAALDNCLRSLTEAQAEGCGCRLMAVDDALLAPLEAFAHAPGVSARLFGLGRGTTGPLIAREFPEISEAGSIMVGFSSLTGPVATAELFADGRAVMRLSDDGTVLEGRRDLRGWRRGRLTERLLLRAPDGRRVIALIGFEPEELAREGLALASWPVSKG